VERTESGLRAALGGEGLARLAAAGAALSLDEAVALALEALDTAAPLPSLELVFTGIVRELGRVEAVEGGDEGVRLLLAAPRTARGVERGGSVALNGCCLTAELIDGERILFQAVPETLRRTSLGRLRPGDQVNVEPAVRAGDPLGGHYMQGHVDGVGRVQSVEAEGVGLRVWIEARRTCSATASPRARLRSRRLADDRRGRRGRLCVALIPHTLAATTLSQLVPGREVNLEADVLAKYVERLVDRP